MLENCHFEKKIEAIIPYHYWKSATHDSFSVSTTRKVQSHKIKRRLVDKMCTHCMPVIPYCYDTPFPPRLESKFKSFAHKARAVNHTHTAIFYFPFTYVLPCLTSFHLFWHTYCSFFFFPILSYRASCLFYIANQWRFYGEFEGGGETENLPSKLLGISNPKFLMPLITKSVNLKSVIEAHEDRD